MKALSVCLLLALALVRSEKECRCSLVMQADGNILVAYEDDDMLTFDHDNCEEEHECADKCADLLYTTTNHGDFEWVPPGTHGINVGDFGCMLFGQDVNEGYGYGYSKLCDHGWIYTNFTFNGAFCCQGGKHVRNKPQCG